MSTNVKNNFIKKFVEFKEFVKQGNYFIDNEQAFKNAFNLTSVSIVMLIIDKK